MGFYIRCALLLAKGALSLFFVAILARKPIVIGSQETLMKLHSDGKVRVCTDGLTGRKNSSMIA